MIIDDYGLTNYINQEQVIRAGGDLIQGDKKTNAQILLPRKCPI